MVTRVDFGEERGRFDSLFCQFFSRPLFPLPLRVNTPLYTPPVASFLSMLKSRYLSAPHLSAYQSFYEKFKTLMAGFVFSDPPL